MGSDKTQKVIDARMRLRDRFEARMARTPGMGDGAPMGSGEPNRHGMPKLPPGQKATGKWPVLDLGVKPDVSAESWKLRVDGACEAPYEIDFAQLMQLPQVEDVSDFHCVTTWSLMDVPWRGVRLAEAIAQALPTDDATHILCHAYDGYTTNLSLVEALKPDVLLVHTAYGEPLAAAHGGPVRVITPQLYAWKGAKWVRRIELLAGDRRGFWEERGYSNSAHPWREDRYSRTETG